MRKKTPTDVRTAIAERAVEYIASSYTAAERSGRKEPCISVGEVTDYLRQTSGMPEDFRYSTRAQQSKWTRSVLEALRRKGVVGSSLGRLRCYEPKP